MGSKIPFKHGAKPVDIYDLDDKIVRGSLGIQTFIDPSRPPKMADKYIRYSNNKFGVLESKSSTLRKAPDQLASTANLLLKAGKQVDYLIVVLEGLSAYEREKLYRIKNDTLCRASDSKPCPVTNGLHSWEIEVFYERQVNRMYDAHNRLFGGN